MPLAERRQGERRGGGGAPMGSANAHRGQWAHPEPHTLTMRVAAAALRSAVSAAVPLVSHS